MTDGTESSGSRSSSASTSRAACTWPSSSIRRSRCPPTRPRDLELALTVLRKRIDEFGVAEPLIQQVGDGPDRGGAARASTTRRAPRRSCSGARFSSSRSPTRPARWRRRCRPWTARSRELGISAGPGSQPSASSAVQQLLGGEHRGGGRFPAPVVGGVLSGLIQPSTIAGGGGARGVHDARDRLSPGGFADPAARNRSADSPGLEIKCASAADQRGRGVVSVPVRRRRSADHHRAAA